MPIKTAISQILPGKILIRGYNLAEFIGRRSFGDIVYLLFTGELPQEREGEMIEAILVSSADHGLTPPSTHTARAVANVGNPFQAAMAAGILAIGEHHGGAGEACAYLLQESVRAYPDDLPDALATRVVAEARAQKRRLPGFGHRFHNPDPRAEQLLALANELGISGKHVALAQAIAKELERTTGRALPLNVDGAIAAILSDMGLDWRYGKALFIIGRAAGMAAHVYEEMATGTPFKFIAPLDVEYVGVKEREL